MTDKWISVKKRLPEYDRNILLVTACGAISTGYYALGRDEFVPDDMNLLYDDVTHWMPLPEPPTNDR